MVTKQRISTATKNKSKTYASKSGVVNTTVTKGNGMYTFVYGTGTKKVSETKHCSEAQADAYQKHLEKMGY